MEYGFSKPAKPMKWNGNMTLTMKKSLIAFAAISMAVAVSCQKETGSVEESQVRQESVVLPQVIHATVDDNETKAGFNYNPSGKTYRHFWETGDEFAVIYHSTTGSRNFCIDRYQSPDGSGDFELQGSPIEYDPEQNTFTKLFCVYPYNVSLGTWSNAELAAVGRDNSWPMFLDDPYYGINPDNPGLFIHIPATEAFDYDANTLGYGNILAARIDNASDLENLELKTCMGWLKIQLTGYNYIKSISVSSPEGKDVAGYYYITFDGSNNPVLNWDEGEYEKTIEINAPYIFPGSSTVPFYFALPPESYNGLTVTITYSDDTTETLETNNTVVIERNMVTPMKAKGIEKNLTATLAAGQTFNAAIKTLANGSSTAYNAHDNLIKTIDLVTDSDVTSSTVVSDAGSGLPVYAVFDNDGDKGELTLHTRASQVRLNANSSYMFQMLDAVASINLLSSIEASTVTNPSFMFRGNSSLSAIDLTKISTAGATDLSYMFTDCSSLGSLDVSGLNTSSATTFAHIFEGCSGLTSLDVSGFNTSSATNLGYMFSGCSTLSTIDVSGFDTSLVTAFGGMFSGCSGLTSLDVSGFNTSSATYLGYMFEGCSGLASIDVSGFDTSNCTGFGMMFKGCSNLATVDVSGFDTTKATSYAQMFYNCPKITSVSINIKNTAVSSFQEMFRGCSLLRNVTVSSTAENTSDSDKVSMYAICMSCLALETFVFNYGCTVDNFQNGFNGCSNVTSISMPKIYSWRSTPSLAALDMYRTFYNCVKLSSLDVRKIDFYYVTNWTDTFYLTGRDVTLTLYLLNATSNNQITSSHLIANKFAPKDYKVYYD